MKLIFPEDLKGAHRIQIDASLSNSFRDAWTFARGTLGQSSDGSRSVLGSSNAALATGSVRNGLGLKVGGVLPFDTVGITGLQHMVPGCILAPAFATLVATDDWHCTSLGSSADMLYADSGSLGPRGLTVGIKGSVNIMHQALKVHLRSSNRQFLNGTDQLIKFFALRPSSRLQRWADP